MKKIVFVILGIIILIGSITFFLKKEKQIEAFTFEKESNSTLGKYIWDANSSDKILEIVNQNSLRVKGESYTKGDYKYSLEEYFYNKEVPFVIYKFIISNKDGSNLTKEQFQDLESLLKNDVIELRNEYSCSSVKNTLEYSDEGAIWISASMIVSVSENDSISTVTGKVNIQQAELFYKNENVATIHLPNYEYQEEKVGFDTSSDDSILHLNVTNMGISIIWDMTDILNQYKKELKNLPKGEDPELHGYSIYKAISLVLEDGSTYKIFGDEDEDILLCNIEEIETNRLSNITVLWKHNVSIDDISYILIDDKKYRISKE